MPAPTGTRRILFVTSVPPWPPTTGGQQRSAHLYAALARHGVVDLLLTGCAMPPAEERAMLAAQFGLLPDAQAALTDGPVAPAHRPRPVPRWVSRLGATVFHVRDTYRRDPIAHARLSAALAAVPYDLVVGRYLRPGRVAGIFEHAPVVLDLDDLDTGVYRSRLEAGGEGPLVRLGLHWHVAQLRVLVPRWVRTSAHIWTAAAEDGETLRRSGVQAATSVLPNLPPVSPVACPTAAPATAAPALLFVGSFGYDVNRRTIARFLAQTWPLIREREPMARCRLVGSGMTDALKSEWARIPGVEVIGYVADLAAEYRAARVTIAPIYEGGGTKIKVLEAAAYARPCVVTPHAHRGYADTLVDGVAVLRAETERDFAAACIALLRDPARATAMGLAAHAVVRRHYSTAAFEQAVDRTLAAVWQATAGTGPAGAGRCR